MYSLMGELFITISFILKSMVVTRVFFEARNSPSVYLQNRAVFPTLTSPIKISLYLASVPPITNLSPIFIISILLYHSKIDFMQSIKLFQMKDLFVESTKDRVIEDIENIYLCYKLNKMQQEYQFTAGKSKISPYMIQQSYDKAKVENQTHQMLTNTFHVLDLARTNLKANQGEIQAIATKSMILGKTAPPKKQYLNEKTVHPLIKGGGFGTLERQCQITDKGLYEKQDKKEPTLKTVIGFFNKIQIFGDKNNEKIDWIKDSKKFKYRLIVQGEKKQPKAIYFDDLQEAQKVRIFYVNKFNYKGNFLKAMKQGEMKFHEAIYENFKYRMIAAKIEKKKKKLEIREQNMNRQSEKLFPTENQAGTSSVGDSPEKNEAVDKIIRSSNPKSQQGYQPKMMDFLNNKKEDERYSTQTVMKKKGMNFGTILKLEKNYKVDFFMKWLQRARQAQKQGQERGRQSAQRDNKQKMDNIFLRNPKNTPKNSYNQDLNKSKMSKSVNKSVLRSSPQKQRQSYTDRQEKSISFTKIQFLNMTQTMVKPIVSLSVGKGGKIQHQWVFNTMIKSKDPHLVYNLIPTNGEPSFTFTDDIANYEINIRAVDYLTNSQLSEDKIYLKSKVFSHYTLLLGTNKDLRLEMKYDNNEFQANNKSMQIFDNPEGLFLQLTPLHEEDLDKIRNFWEEESTKRGYYNVSSDMKIIQIFQLIEEPPVYWSLGLSSEQFKIVSHLNVASKILGFKFIPSMLELARALQKMYSEMEELIEACLSIILYYMPTYYLPQLFNKTEKIHKMVGLEGDIEFSSKCWLQMSIIKKLVKIQVPQVEEKFSRKNICYEYLLYEYIYELYSRVFPIKTLIQLWNFCFRDQGNIRMYLILVGVWLMRFYANKISKCRRFADFRPVLESQQLCPSQVIIKEIIVLKEKYFSESSSNKGLLDSIKGFFNNKPVEQIAIDFYKRETKRMDNRKEMRQVQKQIVLGKLNTELDIELPKYPSRKYCFHIYFYKLPSVTGSLYIKCNNIEYECLNFSKNSQKNSQKNNYYIISEIGTEATLEFVNNKSNQFTAKMIFTQGINKFQVQLRSDKQNQTYSAEYLCGLLTDTQIEALKKNRKFEHYITSITKKEQLFDELLRPINQSHFLNSYAEKLKSEDLGKKIKIIFSSGNKNFNQIEFYLRWISSSLLTLPQKIALVKKYAMIISKQYFLSENMQVSKIFVNEFLKIMGYPLGQLQFDCFYADSLKNQFNAPKILKCRLFLPSGKEFKLEKHALQYFSQKNLDGVYGDIVLSQLLEKIGQSLDTELSNISEATLSFLYSSNGEVTHMVVPVLKKKTSKQLVIDTQKYQLDNPPQKISMQNLQPQLLVTEVMPTFSKITTILDYVHDSQAKSIDKFSKTQRDRQLYEKKIPQKINLLGICQEKIKKRIIMRYLDHPEDFSFPFLTYYHDLAFEIKIPHFPRQVYLNNTKTDINAICCMHNKLNFSDNKRSELIRLNQKLGLYGNLRTLPLKTDSLYFNSHHIEEENPINGYLFVNYGYGVYRWEPCFIEGYNYQIKEKSTGLNQEKKPKKNYLVRYGGKIEYFKEFQIQMNPGVEEHLQELDIKPDHGKIVKLSSPSPRSRTTKNVGLSKLLASNN